MNYFLKLRATSPNKYENIYKIRIENIPSESLPTAEIFSGLRIKKPILIFQYVSHQDIPIYLEQMNKQFNIIMYEIRNKNSEKVIEHLAYYIQLGAVTHIFDRVNMSLILLQANVILNKIGLPGIYHHYLDLLGCALQPDDFLKAFKNYINNPVNQVTH